MPDRREFHAWQRRLELEAAGSWRQRLRIRRRRFGRGISVLRWIWRQTALAGPVVKRRDQVSLARQFCEQWLYAVRYGLAPRDYYQYRLYAPGNRGRVGDYIKQTDIFALLQPLTPGPRFWDKREFWRECVAHGLATIEVLAEWRDRRMEVLNDDWPREVYSKPLLGGHGIEVRAWKDAREELESFLATQEDALVQPRVFNHPELARLSSGSLCTIRINGCRTPSGGVELLLPTLRMPVGGSAVDNFYQGNLVAPVDLQTGRVGPAVSRDQDGVIWPVERHPDTGHPIEGVRLPFLDEAVDLCRRAHAAFPRCAFVGWDVAITSDGPLLVEGNYIFGSEAPQVAHDRPLGETPFAECVVHQLATRCATPSAQPGFSQEVTTVRCGTDAAAVQDQAATSPSGQTSKPAVRSGP